MRVNYMRGVMADLPADAKSQLVLLHLAYFAKENGEAWIELSRIAESCKLSLRAVSSAIKRLKKEGRILVTTFPREPHIYQIVLPSQG